jgi:ferredoxin
MSRSPGGVGQFSRMMGSAVPGPGPIVDHRRMSEVAQVVVDLDGQRHRLSWPRGQTLVDMLVDAGIDVPHSCREGRCGSCVATVIEGEVQMAACDIFEADDLRDGLILACQARPASADVHIEF